MPTNVFQSVHIVHNEIESEKNSKLYSATIIEEANAFAHAPHTYDTSFFPRAFVSFSLLADKGLRI